MPLPPGLGSVCSVIHPEPIASLMTGPRNRWLPVLTEASPTADDPHRRLLTRSGQGLLAAVILIMGLVIYGAAWQISLRMSSRGELCLKLPSSQAMGQGDLFDNQLLRQYQLGRQLIAGIPAATPSQRLRLNEQLNGLVRELDSFCTLIFYTTNEQAALLTLATASATVVLLVVVLVAPEGLQSINRTQRTVFITAGAMLALTLNFLQLGEQQSNNNRAQHGYRGHDALLQRLNSSLANQRLEPGLGPTAATEGLNTSAGVAPLITSIDSQRLAMPDPRLQLSDNVAEDAWSRLLGSRSASGPPQPGAQPAAPAAELSAPAAQPQAPAPERPGPTGSP